MASTATLGPTLRQLDLSRLLSFPCCECSEVFPSAATLEQHISVDHLQWVPYVCLTCRLHKPTEGALLGHLLSSHPAEPPTVVLEPDEFRRAQLQDAFIRSVQLARQKESQTAIDVGVGRNVKSELTPVLSLSAHSTDSPIFCDARPAVTQTRQETGTPNLRSSCRPPKPKPVSQTPQPKKSTKTKNLAGRKRHSAAADLLLPESVKQVKRSGAPSKYKNGPCALCDCTGIYTSTFSHHVYKYHLGKPGLLCAHCDFTSPYSVREVKQHIEKEHPEEDFDEGVIDRRPTHQEEAKLLMARCFPWHPMRGGRAAKAASAAASHTDFDDADAAITTLE